MLFVHVAEATLEVLQHVGLNVLSAPTVHRIKHVPMRNVLIPVLEHAASMLNVKLLTTVRYAVVHPTL